MVSSLSPLQNNQTYTFDRREEGQFVLTDGAGREYVVPELPPEAREGNIYRFENGVLHYCAEETEARRERIQNKFRKLFGKE